MIQEPTEYESDALPTEPLELIHIYSYIHIQLYVAKWSHLEEPLQCDNKLVSMSHLTEKSVRPKPIERQNVSLVLKIFCDETASTMRIRFGKEAEGTYLFIEFILKWWLIVNSKKFGLDQWLKDIHRGAIESENDWQISFLKNEVPYFTNSLIPDKRKKRYRKLTVETAAALCHASQSLAHLAKNLLKQDHHQYVCLGRFQSGKISIWELSAACRWSIFD